MVDMHIHTLYSDGDESLEEVLKKCEKEKLDIISITDHNNCKQYEDEALKKKIFSGKIGGSPCGACRELIYQLGKNTQDIEILVNDKTYETKKMSELLPDWWGEE